MLSASESAKFNKLVDGEDSERLAITFKALSDPNRCKIARLLIAKGSKKLSVLEVAHVIGMSQSSVSQHLKILEITGIIVMEKVGRHHYFHINREDSVVDALVRAVLGKK